MINLNKNKIRNIAVCLSGECRTYNKCSQSIKRFFDIPGVNVKYFGHAWNTNTYKTNIDSKVEIQKEEHDKNFILQDLKNHFNFEHIQVEEKFLQREPWDNLFYSDAKANLFKKNYEFENNMVFDVVIKARYDLAFNPNFKFLDIIPYSTLHQKTLYSEMFLMMKEWYLPNIDDVFYFGTSLTMDAVMSNMPYMVNRVYDEMYPNLDKDNNPFYKAGPGVNMYRWLVQQNMIIHKIQRPCQIYRKQDIPLDPIRDYGQIIQNVINRSLW